MRFANGLPLPVRPFLGPSPHEVIWREADSARVRDILHNSAYAGACWGLCVWAPAKGSEPKRTRISAGWLWRIGRSCQRAAESRAQFSPGGGVGDQPFERSGPPFLGGRPRRLIGGVDDWAVAFEWMCSGTGSAC
jgi:hypothetical protein